MILRRTVAAILTLGTLGTVLVGSPVLAQDYPANSVWGQVPDSVRSQAQIVVLQTISAVEVQRATVEPDGRFLFTVVPAGNYFVKVQTSTGSTLAQSLEAVLNSGEVTRAVFGTDRPAGAYVTQPPPGGGGGGMSTTTKILIGAAVGGAAIATAIVVLSDDDDKPASPSR